MEVRKGYKQTEVGVIPNDWNVRRIDDVCKLINGRGFKPFEWKETGLPIIRIQNLNGSDDFNFFTGIYDKKLEVETGQLLFAWSGSRGTSFGPHVWQGSLGLLNYHTWKIQIQETVISKEFYLHALRFLTAFIEGKAHGAAALVHVQKWEMESFQFPIPPTLAEQETIAEALSDADALIEALEQLLAKKRQVKQGAMQELLTGKRRLPEFSKRWETKKLGDVFEITAGGDFDPTQASDTQDEHFPYPIYSNALTNKGLYGFSSYNNHQAGSITVTARGTLGNANYRNHDFTAIGRVIVLKPTQPLDGRFISEFINNRIDFVVESTGVPQLTAPQISKYEILFPEFPEQTAIAEILSDMDTEIAALEGKLSKAQQVKQGMMQELLTGRVRLV